MAVHVMVTQGSKLEGKAELWYLKTTSLHPSQHIHTQTHTHTITAILTQTHPLSGRSFLSTARGEVRLSHGGGVRRRV